MGKIVQKNKKTFIYTLSDPTNGEVRYVGKTVKSLSSRLTGHIYSIERENNYRTNWIKSLLKDGNIPKIEYLDETTWEYSQDLEIYWISQFRQWGYKLVNASEGGEGNLGLKRSEESKIKSSLSMRKHSKTVYQYTLEGDFISSYSSCIDAAEAVKGRRENISQCCIFNKKSHKGFIWSYLDKDSIDFDVYKHKPRITNVTENNSFKKKSRAVIILDTETGEKTEVASLKEAEEFTGKSRSGICLECQGKRKVKGKFNFKYKK